MLPWNSLLVWAPTKNSVKREDTKIGHKKLNTVARELFDLSNLQSKLCAFVKESLCARWHRQRQADGVGQQWYEAAVRNQARVSHDSRVASPSIVHPSQRQTSPASRRRPASDNTDRSPPHGLTQDPPGPVSTSSELVQSINPAVTAEMLRTNGVPWHVSPARPAILTSVTNIWAGVQDLTLQSLSLSEELEKDPLCVLFGRGRGTSKRMRDPVLRSVPSACPSILRGRVVGKATYKLWHVMLCVRACQRQESSTKRPESESIASGVSGIPRGINRAEWAPSLSQTSRGSPTARFFYLCIALPVGTTEFQSA
ncbi:hypothetical protein DTO013E5_9888 [Penicillium roqueforti]|nr:hypothetical protein DTO012A1_9284 [Penicillium roqueforti]KAI2738664.1 hypothetical protein DTO013F2_9569 [Penicillium roqueforti]KAI2769469.1 hypothetical protein DTO012A8_5495 [Penicillium roqueforti]KAI3062442.1 hypothetical protein CBS147339_9879 [Penicillium roqueforti]KAI3089640.1 hypothetical protein CBS147338_9537 [Penicillium roqueforti]